MQITIRGRSIAALAWGDADAPLALCLHGYPDTAFTWRHLGPFLAERGWRVVAPFSRGYGPTDLASDGGYEVGALVRDIEDLHRTLGGDSRAVLIGHDWGAIAAYAVGAHSPALFARIVTLAVPPAPALFGRLRQLPPSRADVGVIARQLRCSWYIFFQQIPGVSERALPRVVRRLWADWSPGYDADEDLDHLADALEGAGRRTAVLRYYRAFVQPWYRSGDYRSEQRCWAGTPTAPVLYLHGQRDGCLLAELARDAPKVLPVGSRTEVLVGVGHFLQLEAPETVNPLIADFIEH